jgi:hypothetical protein
MASPRRAYVQPLAGAQGFARTRKVLGLPSVSIQAADLVTGGQVVGFRVPAMFVVTGINANVPKLDSGATLTISIGDAANNARLVNASNAGQAGGAITALAAGAAYYQFPIDTDVLLTFPAGPVTPAPGAITNLYLEGFIGP